MSCGPDGVRLLGATPADGYRVEVENEHQRVEVQFEREDPEQQVQVVAQCVDGVPDFQVEGDRDHSE